MASAGVYLFLVLAALVAAMAYVRHRLDTPPQDGRPRRSAIGPDREPDEWLARWHVRYTDVDGVQTDRVIRVVAVRPRLKQFQVWCELRRDRRTFHFGGLGQVRDAVTGEAVDLQSWLNAYQASRRRAAVD